MRLRARLGCFTVECMSTKAAGTSRAAAARAAHRVAERRAKTLAGHEQELTGVLTDYFEAKSRGEKIRTGAQEQAGRLLATAETKAQKITADAHLAGGRLTDQAEKDAAESDAQVAQAVRRLLALGATKPAIAEMTGLTPAVVRAMAREHADHPAARHPATRHPSARNPSARPHAPAEKTREERTPLPE